MLKNFSANRQRNIADLYISRYHEVNSASGRSTRERALQRHSVQDEFLRLLARADRRDPAKTPASQSRAKLRVSYEKETVLFAKTKVVKGFRLDPNG